MCSLKYIFTVLLLLLVIRVDAQNFIADIPIPLDSEVAEVSGVLYLNGKVIVHNDSGGANTLYEINPATGDIERSVTIKGATNIDWEDLCADQQYIYIGDIGNNTSGNRQNLAIYRVRIDSFETTTKDTVIAEIIPFAYADQQDFSVKPENSTDYDAEALIAYNDSLYVFTKNWQSYRCNIYSVPKSPSLTIHQSKRVDSFNANGLVTGADYHADTHKVLLTAYNLTGGNFNTISYLIQLANFGGIKFSNGNITSYEFVNAFISPQIEGVTCVDDNHFYVTAEKIVNFITLAPYIRHVQWDGIGYPVKVKPQIQLKHFHGSGILMYEGNENIRISVYNSMGQLLKETYETQINLRHYRKGVLIIQITDKNRNVLFSRTLINN